MTFIVKVFIFDANDNTVSILSCYLVRSEETLLWSMRMDNGPEFISTALADWAEEHGIEPKFIQPGKPTQNSYVERFNRIYRDEVLNMYMFKTLNEVREITQKWIREYNDERPHNSLGDQTPWEYLAKHESLENSNLGCT